MFLCPISPMKWLRSWSCTYLFGGLDSILSGLDTDSPPCVQLIWCWRVEYISTAIPKEVLVICCILASLESTDIDWDYMNLTFDSSNNINASSSYHVLIKDSTSDTGYLFPLTLRGLLSLCSKPFLFPDIACSYFSYPSSFRYQVTSPVANSISSH